MKTLKVYWLLLMLLTLPALSVGAQDEETILKAERIKKGDLPPEILEAYQKRFPNASLNQIMKIPTGLYKRDWEIEERNKPSLQDEYYTLTLTGDKLDIEALYDRNGNLIRARERAINVKLPENIGMYLADHYPGYHIVKDKVHRLISPKKIQAEWEVMVVKDNDFRRLFFDKDGKFVKERK
ncbi:hypothetical protein [Chitinophaga qingshengii]|uniref:Beta-lactamase-inhibitor-like PepSY-like domain-containing protein n=1 Tax=Chitinophaga qingshengii TaxID=1569794 RepID=A0ABR7TGF3_9BACT|nr:hypothetical protein [Chitinophaga qingshengii]MBC9929479.1 hypothetical protein [Chitinophaga qingshengii]